MITIETLSSFDTGAFLELVSGYTTAEEFVPVRTETEDSVRWELELRPLPEPRVRRFTPNEHELDLYGPVVAQGHSIGAYDGHHLVGVAVVEASAWNRTLIVLEFHVHPASQGRGVGQALMQRVIEKAHDGDFRAVVCETQTANVPAIRF